MFFLQSPLQRLLHFHISHIYSNWFLHPTAWPDLTSIWIKWRAPDPIDPSLNLSPHEASPQKIYLSDLIRTVEDRRLDAQHTPVGAKRVKSFLFICVYLVNSLCPSAVLLHCRDTVHSDLSDPRKRDEEIFFFFDPPSSKTSLFGPCMWGTYDEE